MEVISASNTVQEMVDKRTLYSEARASECWICNEAGVVEFYLHRSGQQMKSVLVPDFPDKIEW